jgi:hypothetical protein
MLCTWGMTLPYPYEAETGRLKPAPRAPRAPFDIEEHLLEAIRPAGNGLSFFGVRLAPPHPHNASEVAWVFRDALIGHFQKHRPDADEATWELFLSQARAQLDRHPRADDELLRTLMLGIDGL